MPVVYIKCFDIKGAESLKERFDKLIEGKDLTEQEQREIGIKLIDDAHKELHGKLNTLKKQVFHPTKPYSKVDVSEQRSAINKEYEDKINEQVHNTVEEKVNHATLSEEEPPKISEEVKSNEPKEGDQIIIESSLKGGMVRNMQFSEGEWKQNVGGELVKVGASAKERAQEKFSTALADNNVEKETPELNRDRSKKNISDAILKLKDLLSPKLPEGTQKMGYGMDDLLSDVEKIIHKGIDAGFDMKEAVEKGIDHMRSKWKDVSKEPFDENKIRVSLLGEGGRIFSTKNKTVDQRAKELGVHNELIAATEDGIRDFGKVWDEAMTAVGDKDIDPVSLRNELKNNPRPVTDLENAVLLQDMINLENDLLKINEAINKEPDTKRMNQLLALREKTTADLEDNFIADKNAGKATARGLSARRMIGDRRFSLQNIKNEMRSAKRGVKLSSEEEQLAEDLFKKVKEKADLYDKLIEQKKAGSEVDIFKAIKESVKTERKKMGLTKAELIEKDELRKKLLSGRFNDIQSIAALLAEKDFYRYTKLVLKEALGDFESFSKQLIEDFSESIKEHIPSIYEKLKSEENKVIEFKNGKYIIPDELVRNIVEKGVDNIDDLTNEILEVVKKEYPNATYRDVRDSITKYGEQKKSDQRPISVKIRQMKEVGRLLSAYEDVQNKIRPLRSGLKRDELTAKARELKKKINNLMKDLPIDETDLEKKWKSALDATKQRIRNSIEDLNIKIENVRNGIKNEKPEYKTLKGDNELDDLKKKKDDLVKELSELENDNGVTYEERVNRSIASSEKRLEYLEGLLRGEEKKPKSERVSSDKLKALRQEIKKKSDELKEINRASGEIERVRNERYQKRAKEQTELLREKLKNGDVTKRAKVKTELNNESLLAKKELNKAKLDVDNEILRIKLAQRGFSEKGIDAIIKYTREGLLTGVHTLGKLGSFALTRQLVLRPIYNSVGKLLKVIPRIGTLSEGAPIEGDFNASALGEGYKNFFSRKTAKESLLKLKTGKSTEDILYGSPRPQEMPLLPTRVHGAIKEFAFQSERAFAQKAGETWLEKNGLSDDPIMQDWVRQYAYTKGKDAIYMGDSAFLKGYQRFVSNLESSDNSAHVAAGKIARFMFPIVKVPYNFGKDVFISHSPLGLANTFRKIFTKSIDEMSPEQRDLLMLNLKKGAVGTVCFVIGMMNKDKIGGLYSSAYKRISDDVNAGDISIGDFILSHYYMHNAPAEMMQMGATWAKIFEATPEDYGTMANITMTTLMTGLAEAQKLPFYGEMAKVGRATATKQGISDYMGDLVGSKLIPTLIYEIAKAKDDRNVKATGFSERIQSRIPGLRNNLNEKVESTPIKKAPSKMEERIRKRNELYKDRIARGKRRQNL